MSKIQVDTIVNKEDTGAPDFPNGATITGVATATSIKVGTAVTISSGVVEATSFVGSASSMTGITGKAAAMSIVFG
jgi:hypothetical protein